MTMRPIILSLCLICLILVSPQRSHATSSPETANKATDADKTINIDTKPIRDLDRPKWLEAFLKEGTPAQKHHFTSLFGAHNIVRTVEIVHKDVGGTAQKCVAKHEDLQAEMAMRYQKWEQELSMILKEARANIDNMIMAQDYLPSENVKEFLTQIDQQRTEMLNQQERVHLSSHESCQHLMETIEETQERFTQLLRQTLISHAVRKPEQNKHN